MPSRVPANHAVLLDFLYIPLVPFFVYLDLDVNKLAILGLLLLTDLLAGISKAYVMSERVTYERAVAGILSKTFVLLIPIILALGAKAIVEFSMHDYIEYVISALVIAEIYSILGNVLAIKTKNNSEDLDLISFVIRGIRKFMERLLIGFRK